MSAAYVYSVFDKDRDLIYVGASRDVLARMRQHAAESWWIDQAVKIKATVHPSVDEARAVESQRIRDLHPRWNIVGQSDLNSWSPEQFRDYVTARLRFRAPVTSFTIRHLERIAKAHVRRFGYDLALEAAA